MSVISTFDWCISFVATRQNKRAVPNARENRTPALRTLKRSARERERMGSVLACGGERRRLILPRQHPLRRPVLRLLPMLPLVFMRVCPRRVRAGLPVVDPRLARLDRG